MATVTDHDLTALEARGTSAAEAQMTPKVTPTADLKKVALWYAKNGFPVFPIHSAPGGICSCGDPSHSPTGKDPGKAGKHPRTTHGFIDATTDQGQIEIWWTKWPDSNIAIPTGKKTGTLVVDIDPRNDGD